MTAQLLAAAPLMCGTARNRALACLLHNGGGPLPLFGECAMALGFNATTPARLGPVYLDNSVGNLAATLWKLSIAATHHVVASGAFIEALWLPSIQLHAAADKALGRLQWSVGLPELRRILARAWRRAPCERTLRVTRACLAATRAPASAFDNIKYGVYEIANAEAALLRIPEVRVSWLKLRTPLIDAFRGLADAVLALDAERFLAVTAAGGMPCPARMYPGRTKPLRSTVPRLWPSTFNPVALATLCALARLNAPREVCMLIVGRVRDTIKQ
jgi:hypothetical protein